MPATKTGTLRFTVDSKLLFELGEQLVARKWVALAELVKNAYDADATKVEITLLHAGKKSGRIVVEDDGVGMPFEELKESWMRLGTTTKITNPRSEKYGRLRTGAKGVGRFACRRIASTLRLASIPDGRRECIQVTFQWDRFRPGKELRQIGVDYKRIPLTNGQSPGVTLTLEKLREPWTRDDIRLLQKELLQLVSPDVTQYSNSDADPGFALRINAPEYPDLSGSLADQFTETAWATLSGTLNTLGRATYKLTIAATGKVFTFKPSVTFPTAGPCSFSLAYVIYRGEFFRNVPFTVADARDYGREHGGVRIYMDGFRIFPYGEPGDDWLELDADRARRLTGTPAELQDVAEGLERPMLLLPGNMQLFGGMRLSREANPTISLSITRERLLENDAFNEVRRFVRLGINWLTVQYARLGVKQRNRSGAAQSSPLTHLEQLRAEIAGAPDLEETARQRMLQALTLARADYEREQNEQISELSMLRILASVGTMVVIFDHELRALVDSLHGIVTDTKAVMERLTGSERRDLQDVAKRLGTWTESVEQQGAYLGLLLSPESRQRRRRFLLNEIVAEAAKSFKRYRQEMSIDFRNDVPKQLRTPAVFKSELHSIILNLLTNALKATRRADIRKIRATAYMESDSLVLEMCDSGAGIPEDIRDSVFEPFVSTSEPDPLLGVGTGLGLKIVRDIVESYGGKASVADAPKGWATCIRVSLPVHK